MSHTATQIRWQDELRARFHRHWWLKTLGIPSFFCAFFPIYFALLRDPAFPVTEIPVTAIDRLLSFQPLALIPYASLWLYVVLAPSFLQGRREVATYCGAVVALTATGFLFFWAWPTATPRPSAEWSVHSPYGWLKAIDASGNACPSLHAAFAVFTAIWLERLLRRIRAPFSLRVGNTVWCAAILYATLATRQHVAIDLIAGVALGGAAALPYPREDASLYGAPYSWLNRQTLAFGVSIISKIVLFVLDLPATHPLATVVIFLAPDVWILVGLLVPNCPWLVPTAISFATERAEIWLTIDDGPDPATTREMLRLLAQHEARATFFVIGDRAQRYPELVRQIEQHGHCLGNHTETHPLGTFWLAGPSRTAREVGRWRGASERGGARWFRPPAGIKSFFLRSVLARHGAILVGWSARGRENLGPSIVRPLERLKQRIRPGAIILVHEHAEHGRERVALLAALLEHLTASGYRCVVPDRAQLRPAWAEIPAGVSPPAPATTLPVPAAAKADE